MADREEKPVPLPSAPIIQLEGSATLQPPLTRRGYGPGIVIIKPEDPPSPSEETPKDRRESSNESDNQKVKTLDPLPQKKWAEEGYAVVQLVPRNGEQEDDVSDVSTALSQAIAALEKLESCNVKDRFGLIGKRAMIPHHFHQIPIPSHGASSTLMDLVMILTCTNLRANLSSRSIWGASRVLTRIHVFAESSL